MARATAGPLTQRHQLDANATSVAALAFAHAGARLAAGVIDGRVLLWDLGREAQQVPAMLSLGAGAGILPPARVEATVRVGEGDARLIELQSNDAELLDAIGDPLV